MKKIFDKYYNNPFVRNVLIMVSGTAGAQLITMILSPLITRIYGPESFGILGIFTAMISMITPLAALTYPIALVLPRRDEDAKALYDLSIVISILLSAISFFIILSFKDWIVTTFNIEEISSYLFLIPVVIMSSAFLQVNEQWSIRNKQFKIAARASIFQSVIVQGGKVFIGFKYPLATVLIILTAVGEGIKAILLYVGYVNSNITIFTKISLSKMKKVAIDYSDFPKYRAPEVLINAISQSLPALLLATFFNPTSVGFYTLTRSVLSMPTILIGKSLGDVFYPEAANAKNNGADISKIIFKSTVTLAFLGVIPFGVVIIFGPQLFGFVFGSEWIRAGEYARWISLWSYFGFINIPSVKAIPILSAQVFHLFITVLMLVTRALSLLIGYFVFENDLISIALFSISGAILNLILIIITIKISRKSNMI